MIKRDRLLTVMIWLPWTIMVLGFVILLILLYKLFSAWSSMGLLLRGGIIFSVIGLLFAIPKALRPILKGEGIRQWKRVEAMRMNMQKASLYKVQPEANETALVLPARLCVHLSGVLYLGFTVFWLLVVGVILSVRGIPFNAIADYGLFLLIWVAFGGTIIGLTGILIYLRIDITEQALIVRRGLKQGKIPWEQARLFAVVSVLDGEGMPVQYELSSEHELLRWNASYPVGFGFVTCPKENVAYEQLLGNLLAYISARTGLSLLDLCWV